VVAMPRRPGSNLFLFAFRIFFSKYFLSKTNLFLFAFRIFFEMLPLQNKADVALVSRPAKEDSYFIMIPFAYLDKVLSSGCLTVSFQIIKVSLCAEH
jgi:hypothetical protein